MLATVIPNMEKGVPIRSLSRGIAVLQAVNRGRSLTMMEISRVSQVPYPTACRLVQTLLHEGLIEREPDRKQYRPTALVRTLAHGFQGDANLTRLAREHIVRLTRDVEWPITLTTRVGHSMVIQDSTHSLTTLTFNSYFPGYAMPMLEAAAGIVTLSYLPREERQQLFDSMKRLPGHVSSPVLELFLKEQFAADVREQGYAVRLFNQFTENPGKTSSIAVPIFDSGKIIGALTLAFFASAVKCESATDEFFPKMQATSRAIAYALRQERAAESCEQPNPQEQSQ